MRKIFTVIVGLLLSVVSFQPLVAGGSLAEEQVSSGAISFEPLAEYEALTLRVSGPDGAIYEVESDGAALSFELEDGSGNPLPDGSYNYELVATPSQQQELVATPSQQQEVGTEPQSGHFTISGGLAIVDSDEEGGAGLKASRGPKGPDVSYDQVILDDLIVDGSACIGLDCVNGESFGFDTIRIKENNLRIRAVDTSSTASFPSRDWQITFNDSSNGGANKFSIDDIDGGRTPFTLEAGAPSHSLYVDDGGRLGLGTNTPVVDVHVKTGNTPTLRLEQDGSSGFTPQTWDVAGNEANFFIRDATNGSTLPFRIEPGAPSNVLYLEDTGDVGIGTTSPTEKLHVNSTGAANLKVTADGVGILLQDTGNPGHTQIFLDANLTRIRGLDNALATETATGISIDHTDGNIGINCTDGGPHHITIGDGDGCAGIFSGIDAGDALITTSSRTIKENLNEFRTEGILEKIAAIQVYTYDFITGPQDKLGLMAEDFHQVFERGSDKLIKDREVQMALWMAVQVLTDQNQDLKERLVKLEALPQD